MMRLRYFLAGMIAGWWLRYYVHQMLPWIDWYKLIYDDRPTPADRL